MSTVYELQSKQYTKYSIKSKQFLNKNNSLQSKLSEYWTNKSKKKFHYYKLSSLLLCRPMGKQ